MCDEDEDIDGSKLTVDSDLSTRMGAGHYIIRNLTVLFPRTQSPHVGTCGQGMVAQSFSWD